MTSLGAVLAALARDGVQLRLAPDGVVRVVPAAAVPRVRELVAPLGGREAVAAWLREHLSPAITFDMGQSTYSTPRPVRGRCQYRLRVPGALGRRQYRST